MRKLRAHSTCHSERSLTSSTQLFQPPGFQHLVERTVLHERFAIRFLLNLAVFAGGAEKFLDIFKSQETLCDSLRMGRRSKRCRVEDWRGVSKVKPICYRLFRLTVPH